MTIDYRPKTQKAEQWAQSLANSGQHNSIVVSTHLPAFEDFMNRRGYTFQTHKGSGLPVINDSTGNEVAVLVKRPEHMVVVPWPDAVVFQDLMDEYSLSR